MTARLMFSDGQAVQRLWASVIQKWGKIDILVNNVGIHRTVLYQYAEPAGTG
jgi:NAD(P)-dependent dehydrogenase (short-subunit alcohol dehydrogenase family)